jgi:hypothetical protein
MIELIGTSKTGDSVAVKGAAQQLIDAGQTASIAADRSQRFPSLVIFP